MTDRKAYRIIKWDEKHTNHEQKRSGGTWIRCGTSFDSLGLRKLLSEPRGLEHFGAYILFSELAAKMPTPGVLANDQGPMDADSIALVTGASAKRLDAALTRMQRPDLGWIDEVAYGELSVSNPDSVRNLSDPSRARAPAAGSLPASQGGVGENDGEPQANADLVAVLRRMKGQKRHVAKIAEQIGCAGDAVAFWHDIAGDPKVKTVLGCISHRLDADEKPPAMTVEALLAAINAGIVESINGRDVRGVTLKHNGRGVYLDGELLVPTERLREARLG